MPKFFHIFDIVFLATHPPVIFPVAMAAYIVSFTVACLFSGRRLFVVAGKFKDVRYALLVFQPLSPYTNFCFSLFINCINASIFVISLLCLKLLSVFSLRELNVTNFEHKNLKLFYFVRNAMEKL